MLEGAPPRLDHRVRFGDLDMGEDAVEAFGQEGSVDGGVDVLDAGVGHDRDRWSCVGGIEMLAGLDEDLARGGGIEWRTDGPGKDLPGEVVDDRVDVCLGAVEQLQDRHVDVPDFVGASGADADGRFGGVSAKARAAPTALANEPSPRGDGREDLANALGVEAEGAQGHVAVLGSENHVFDGGDLGGRELAGHGSPRTWGTIVEAAGDGDALPRVVAGRRQADDPKDQIEGDRTGSALVIARRMLA